MDNDRFQPVDMRRISHSELLAMIAQGKTPVPNSATLDGQTSYDCPHCRDTGRVTVIERHHGVDCDVVSVQTLLGKARVYAPSEGIRHGRRLQRQGV